MIRGPFDEVSNRADFIDVVEVHDSDTRELVDLTSTTIIMQVASQTTPPWGSGNIVLRASTADGSIAIVGLGVFEFVFPVGNMRGLMPANYDIGATFIRDARTVEIRLGSLPVVDGIVRP